MLVEHRWIQNLWQLLKKYNVNLEGLYITPVTNRKNDYPLIEQLIQADVYNNEELQRMNRCRIHVQVLNLSEITNGTGNSITYCTRNHIRDPE